jgi:hypothetical protein
VYARTPITPVPPASLVSRLLTEGFLPGTPPGLSSYAITVDSHAVAKMRCPSCGKRSMKYHPYHAPKGNGFRYVVIAECQRCGREEEF